MVCFNAAEAYHRPELQMLQWPWSGIPRKEMFDGDRNLPGLLRGSPERERRADIRKLSYRFGALFTLRGDEPETIELHRIVIVLWIFHETLLSNGDQVSFGNIGAIGKPKGLEGLTLNRYYGR